MAFFKSPLQNNRNCGSSARKLIDEIKDEDVRYKNEKEENEFVEIKSLDPDSDE